MRRAVRLRDPRRMRIQSAPDRIKKLALIDTAARPDTEERPGEREVFNGCQERRLRTDRLPGTEWPSDLPRLGLGPVDG